MGVWEGDRFIGAVVFGRGSSDALVARHGLSTVQGCELVRVALTDHRSPVSQIVAGALRILKQGSPGLRLVVSFADPHQSHHGGIYQAGNWIYTGTTAPTTVYLDAVGREHHDRTVNRSGVRMQFGRMTIVPRSDQMTKLVRPGKHRYLYPLDRAMRRQVSKLALPFPPAVEGSTVSRPGSAG